MKKVMTNNQQKKMTEDDLKSFLLSKNFYEMSVEKLNYYFDIFSDIIMKDAVYPHLSLQK